jgi:hypothetical protein
MYYIMLNITAVILASTIRKYVIELPRPIILNNKKFYEIKMEQKKHKLHPDIPSTTMWTYNGILGPLLLDIIIH